VSERDGSAARRRRSWKEAKGKEKFECFFDFFFQTNDRESEKTLGEEEKPKIELVFF
jgi:hypothetical protein